MHRPRLSHHRKIHLNFKGYWRSAHRHALPNAPGVVCVYRAIVDPESGAVKPLELLDAIHTTEAREALRHHPKESVWQKALRASEELCFTFALSILDRKRAAAAIAAVHQPRFGPLNPSEAEDTEMILSGTIALLRVSFSSESGLQNAPLSATA